MVAAANTFQLLGSPANFLSEKRADQPLPVFWREAEEKTMFWGLVMNAEEAEVRERAKPQPDFKAWVLCSAAP